MSHSAPSPPPSSSDAPESGTPGAKTDFRARARSIGATGLFLLALIAALHFGRAFILPVAIAITLTLMLGPIVRTLRRFHIPEAVGAGFVVLSLVGALVFITTALHEPVMDWAQRAPETLRKVEYKLRNLERRVADVGRAAAEVEKLTDMDEERVPAVEIKGEDLQTTLARRAAGAVSSTVIVLALLYFLLATRARFLHEALGLLVRPAEGTPRASIVADTEQNVSRYLFTIAAINVGLGVAVGAAMWAWQMPNPLLWGVMAALMNFVPYLGAMVGVASTALVAIVTFTDLRWVAVPLTYLLLTSLEGTLITPVVLGRRFALDPVVVFLWLIFWAWLWGIGGALLAMPMLVMLRIISDRATGMAPVGRLISNARVRMRSG